MLKLIKKDQKEYANQILQTLMHVTAICQKSDEFHLALKHSKFLCCPLVHILSLVNRSFIYKKIVCFKLWEGY